jgi:ribulose-5-phosphate 4-epimerase/fuculose-1-phosphate aldolase
MTATTATAPAGSAAADERQVRTDLAACYRLFVHFGWTDLIFTHLSARVPGTDDLYLINPYGLLFEEVTASNLLKVDFDGEVVGGDRPYNAAGHAIHTAVYRVRPDVQAVLHSHTRAGMTVSTMECGLLPLTQQANEVMEIVGYHAYDDVTSSDEECEKLGADLGDKYAMILHNHGLLSAGRSVAEAFYFLYTLENACKVQVDALHSGADLVLPDKKVRERVAAWSRTTKDRPVESSEDAWPALLRMLDRRDPSYRS